MAVIKFTNSKSGIKKILDYITQPSKTEDRLISGKDCSPLSALTEMELVKNMYGKNSGRQYIHIVQSFNPKDNLTYEKANQVGLLLADRFTGFQAIVATHKDKNHIHNHILLNSVNFETGLKFQQSKKEMQDVKDFSDKLCLENGLSIIEKPTKDSDIGRNEYQTAVKGESWKIQLIVTIDEAIKVSKSKDEFISNMNRFGYEVKWTDERKNITYTTPDAKKCRDNKLHDEIYLKEKMENEFRRIKGKTQEKFGNRDSKHQVSRNKQNSNPTGKVERKSILNQLEIAKANIKRDDDEKRLYKNIGFDGINQLNNNSCATGVVKKKQHDFEI